MSTRKPGTISVLLTVLLLTLLGVVLLLLEMLALNGVSEKQGVTAISISLVCQAGIMVLAGICARWITNFLITRAAWNSIMAVAAAVLVAVPVGGAISFLFMIIAIPLAGIQ